jgi:hypothetical protein
MTCTYCEEPLLPEEQGKMEGVHVECAIRAVMGSAAHQLGECRCNGGSREDPPGVSKREAAKLAYDTFLVLRGRAA